MASLYLYSRFIMVLKLFFSLVFVSSKIILILEALTFSLFSFWVSKFLILVYEVKYSFSFRGLRSIYIWCLRPFCWLGDELSSVVFSIADYIFAISWIGEQNILYKGAKICLWQMHFKTVRLAATHNGLKWIISTCSGLGLLQMVSESSIGCVSEGGLWDCMLVGEGNKTFFIRVQKFVSGRCVLKLWGWRQYVIGKSG